jgi:hypothetical protein
MAQCILAIVAFAITWLATAVLWILVVLFLALVFSGPFGWVIVAAVIGTLISVGLLIWAFTRCAGR